VVDREAVQGIQEEAHLTMPVEARVMSREAVDVEIQGEDRPVGQVVGPGAVPGP
jgi:hypothetical protein